MAIFAKQPSRFANLALNGHNALEFADLLRIKSGLRDFIQFHKDDLWFPPVNPRKRRNHGIKVTTISLVLRVVTESDSRRNGGLDFGEDPLCLDKICLGSLKLPECGI